MNPDRRYVYDESRDPYNGNIEFDNETQWMQSRNARLEQERRDMDNAVAASQNPYNGNIEFDDETRWMQSSNARLQQERRDMDIAISASLEKRTRLDDAIMESKRIDDIHEGSTVSSAQRHLRMGDYPIDRPRDGDNRTERNFMARAAQREPIEKHTCDKCDLHLSSQAELADHMDMHQHAFEVGWGERTVEKKNMPTEYPCDKCDRVFQCHYDASVHRGIHKHAWDLGWKEHRERNKGNIVSCGKCTRAFSSAIELEDHILRIHPVFTCTRYGCVGCFRSASELEDHVWFKHRSRR